MHCHDAPFRKRHFSHSYNAYKPRRLKTQAAICLLFLNGEHDSPAILAKKPSRHPQGVSPRESCPKQMLDSQN